MPEEGCVLFVDSDVNQLQSLSRSLRDQRQWRLLYAESPGQALALMEQQPVDILVSETRLDGSEGSDLLRETQRLHPLTTRVLFSGVSTHEPAQEVVRHAHQFIAKPCPRETLITILDRLMALRDLLHNSGMRELINSLGTLPSLPGTYTRLIEMLRSEETTVRDVGRLVEQDLAMSAKLLQMVNSAFFGLRRRIASPVDAVALLGIETVANLALTSGIFAQLPPSLVTDFDLDRLWQHSLSVAGLTRRLCGALGLGREQSETPVLAGLLHDLGKLVLATADTEEYLRIVRQSHLQGQPLYLVEAEALWADHAAVGAYLMGLWGLPYAAVEAVALHHCPERQQRGRPQCLAVYAANLLIHNQTDSGQQTQYATDQLESILGREATQQCVTITREFLA